MTILYLFTDWSSAKAKQETGYPASRIIAQDYQLMSIQETEQFIKNKLKQLNKYINDPTGIPDCTPEDLWQRESVFKYYRNPEKLDRSTKNFSSYWEANQRFTEDGAVGRVIEVKGEVVFCKYCNARNICNQAKQYVAEGRLVV